MHSTLIRVAGVLSLLVSLVYPARSGAAPNIADCPIRGLQIGGTTTLVISGSDLLPAPRLVASFPITAQAVRSEAQAGRVEIEVQVPGEVTPGIYEIWFANEKGVSDAIVVGLDHLPQQRFSEQISSLPVALHGKLTGTDILTTKFVGKKGQRIVADVEAQRLGAQLKPILRIKDSRGRQVAWSPGLPQIVGDARVEFEVSADDEYTVELHDLLFRGAAPGYFRLKLGELKFADLAFPLGVQAGTKVPLQFASSNIPSDVTVEWQAPSFSYPTEVPAGLPSSPLFSGGQPRVAVSSSPELVEATPAAGSNQMLSTVPVAVSGRIDQPKQEDHYNVPCKPGSRLRISVVAQAFGSPLDGVLTVRDAAGNQLAMNDDRPGNPDPGLELKVPEKVEQIVVSLKDLLGRGGLDFVYRIQVTDAADPAFSVTADTDRLNIPVEGTQTLRLQVTRANYNGKIKLAFEGLPSNISVLGDEIPAGETIGLVSLSAASGSPVASLVQVKAQDARPKSSASTRLVRNPETQAARQYPWLRDWFAIAVTEPAPVSIAWAGPVDSPMLLGEKLPLTVSLNRREGVSGNVRLRLLTTQPTPKKKIKERNRDTEVDDVDRALRLEGEVTVTADAKQATAQLIVPADLPAKEWGLVLAADLMSKDNKTVIASTTTSLITRRPQAPFQIELAAASDIQARAGAGETGKLAGKLKRQPGFAKPVVLTLAGLPKEYSAPQTTVAADKETFELPVSFAYGAKPAELKDVKLVAQYQPDPKNEALVIRSEPVSLGVIKVVPGDPPPPGQVLAIFEDDEKFISYLSKGGGQITLDAQEKYSGSVSAKVTPDQRYHEEVPGLNVKIRENPGPGEFRYLRFAWKKKGGAAICLQLNHDGAWGVGGSGKPGAKFRYHAGPGGECYGASLLLDNQLPQEFVVVTRDLFADFGEFTLTGLALSPVDGEYGLFDHLHLARGASDFDQLKPAK